MAENDWHRVQLYNDLRDHRQIQLERERHRQKLRDQRASLDQQIRENKQKQLELASYKREIDDMVVSQDKAQKQQIIIQRLHEREKAMKEKRMLE